MYMTNCKTETLKLSFFNRVTAKWSSLPRNIRLSSIVWFLREQNLMYELLLTEPCILIQLVVVVYTWIAIVVDI